LPRWNQAPLGLAKGSKAQLVQFLDPHRTRQQDFVLSPYRKEDWSDLWRFEIQISDHEGQLKDIVESFDELGVLVLASESRKTYDDEFAIKHFVISASNYKSERDGSSAQRRNDPSLNLSGLRDYFFAKFATELRYSEGVRERLLVERNWPHYGLFNDLATRMSDNSIQKFGRDRIVNGPSEITIGAGGFFDLPEELIASDNKLGFLPGIKNRVYVSSNPRSNIAYISTYRDDHVKHVSVAVYFAGREQLMAQLLGVICSKPLGLNIVRHQLREGCIGESREVVNGVTPEDRIFTLNLLLEAKDNDYGSRGEFFEAIRTKLIAVFAEKLHIKHIIAEDKDTDIG
jgi:hypothetical protein